MLPTGFADYLLRNEFHRLARQEFSNHYFSLLVSNNLLFLSQKQVDCGINSFLYQVYFNSYHENYLRLKHLMIPF